MEQVGTEEKRGPGRPLSKTLKTILEEESKKVIDNTQNLTQEEKAIYSRVISESTEWQTINERDVNDFSLSEDPFKLPEPAQKLRDKKQFAFRWIERKPERLDAVKNAQEILRWWPVNRVQPVVGAFDAFVDGSTGAVHLLDQMLVFKPWWLYERELKHYGKLANTGEDLTAKDGKELNDLRFAASRRKTDKDSKVRRTEITGSDIQFRGEADVDALAAAGVI